MPIDLDSMVSYEILLVWIKTWGKRLATWTLSIKKTHLKNCIATKVRKKQNEKNHLFTREDTYKDRELQLGLLSRYSLCFMGAL